MTVAVAVLLVDVEAVAAAVVDVAAHNGWWFDG